MALTKSFLSELGVDSNLASAIMAEHGKMQTGYLKRIEDLEAKATADNETSAKTIADLTATHNAKITELKETLKSTETKYATELATVQMEHRTATLLDAAKPFDKTLVASLLDIEGLDVSKDTFDTEYNARITKLKTDKPFLFEAVKEQDSKDEDNGAGKQFTGYVPAKNTQEGAPITSYSRVGAEMYPNISNIIDFSD